MNFILLFLVLSAFAQSPMSSNGNGVGNGGDMVSCKVDGELLDFTEAKLLKRFEILRRPMTDWKHYSQVRLEILNKVDSRLSAQYKTVLSTIHNRLKFIENADFRDVPDSFEIAIPSGCKLEQVAIQQDGQIHINKKLWDKLDGVNHAGLIMHEIIYEHFITLGEKNSVKVRQFNAMLFSNELNRMTTKEYQEYVRLLGLKLY